MTFEGYVALLTAIGLPVSIFTLQAFVDKRIEVASETLRSESKSEFKEFRLEHKVFRAQISQLQARVALLNEKAGLERDSGFLRDVD